MVRSAGMKGFSRLLRELGVNPQPLLGKHGLPQDLGENDDEMVSLRAIVALMEDSAAVTGCSDLGLKLAAHQDIQVLGPLATAIQHSASVREALNTASHYLFVHSPALVFSVLESSSLVAGAVELRMEVVLSRLSSRRQTLDQCLGVVHRVVKFFAGSQYQLLAVALPHTPLADLQAYKSFFGAPVHTDQEYAALHVSPKTLNSGLADVNAALRTVALDYLERQYGDPNLSMTDRVRRALRSTLSSTGGSKSAIADLLFVHPRTLQRRLAAEDATFDAIRDEVRREAAERYLNETRIPLAQLASLLGLADQSVLTRLCLRWFDTTPSAMRKRSRALQAGASQRLR
ncbi:HTH-type transcriptional regulator VirS [compost metagenome]